MCMCAFLLATCVCASHLHLVPVFLMLQCTCVPGALWVMFHRRQVFLSTFQCVSLFHCFLLLFVVANCLFLFVARTLRQLDSPSLNCLFPFFSAPVIFSFPPFILYTEPSIPQFFTVSSIYLYVSSPPLLSYGLWSLAILYWLFTLSSHRSALLLTPPSFSCPPLFLLTPPSVWLSLAVIGGDLQSSCGAMDEGVCDDALDWEEERELERVACEGEDFVPPKIMVRHSSDSSSD